MFDEDILLHKLEHDGLRGEIIINMFLDLVMTVPIFQVLKHFLCTLTNGMCERCSV